MKNLVCILIAILLSYSYVPAQNDSTSFSNEKQQKPVKSIKLSYISAQVATQKELGKGISASDFAKLASQSELLPDDFAEYNSICSDNFNNDYTSFELLLGIKFGNKNKNSYRSNPELRIGVNASIGSNFSSTYNKSYHRAFDTLTSGLTGNVIYQDSVIDNSYDMDFRSLQISFDGSLIFRSNQQRKVSFYTGLGFTVGVSINSETSIFYEKLDGTTISLPNGNSYNNLHYGDWEWEDTKYDGTFMRYSAYVPLGIELKAWGKSNFWQHTHLFCEIRLGANFISIPELGTLTRFSIQSGFGLKYNFN